MTSSTTPTLWFSPPAPNSMSPNSAGEQFMDLFNDPSTWQVTSSQSMGFALSETFVLMATDAQLTTVLNYLNAHHLKLMMVSAVVPVQANGVGNGQEGFGTAADLTAAAQRIKALGGTLDAIGMDAPLYAGHESPGGAQLSITALAQQVAGNVAGVQSVFPTVQFYSGDGLGSTSDLGAWAQAFKAATGTPITEFDADMNWNQAGWQAGLEAYAAAAKAAGVAVGIAGNATSQQTTNLSWALAAEANIAAAVADPSIGLATVGVQSWDANPTVILPEGLSGTLSHVAAEASQFMPLYASGYLTGGKGVTVSTSVPAPSYVGSAVDAVAGSPIAVSGVQISAANAPGAAAMTYAAVITAVAGDLSATAHGAGHVSGAGTNIITLTGSLADINAELSSLTYTGSSAGTDTIDVTTYDGVGLVDDHQLAVSIAAPVSVDVPAGVGLAALYQNIYGQAPSASVLAAAKALKAGGETVAQVAAPWIAQAQATIASIHEQVTGSSPSATKLANLMKSLMGGETVSQIRTQLAASAGAQSELKAVYANHYGTAPTASQLAALTNQLALGTNLAALEAPLLANSPDEAQITALYQQVEGQAPGASDLVTNTRALLTGTPLATIRTALATSALVQGNLAALYQHVYDTPATPAQLAALTAELEGTTTYAQVQAQLTAVAQSEVTGFFQAVLGRNPTANELSNDTANIVSGNASLSGTRASLAFSAESTANVTKVYQQVIGQTPPQSMITELEEVLSGGGNPAPLSQLGTELSSAATLYQQITGQAVTADALTPLMYDFLNQATVAQIRQWVGFSGQENQIIGNLYQQLFGNPITGDVLNTIKLALVAGTTTMAAVQASLTAQAAADAPVISGVVANQTELTNSAVQVLGAINITDPDPGAIETASVSLSGSGVLLTGPLVIAAPAIYSVKGTASNVTAYVRGLTFVGPTGSGTTWISLKVQNGAGTTIMTKVAINTSTLRSPVSTDFLYAPTDNTSIAAMPNETIVMPATGFGAETITGFNTAQGVIELPHAIAGSFAAVQAHEAASGGGTLISFGPSESIFLPGIAPTALHAANFSFA